MLYLVGLGLHDETDISVKGLEAAKAADRLFAEFYTCPIRINMEKLEAMIGKEVKVLDRKGVEESDKIIEEAKSKKVVFFVGGDPLSATTHADIILRARKLGIRVKIIHSSSIFSAIAETGLHLYKFGKTTSIPIPQKNYRPTSFFDVIKDNKSHGLHTLCLLDIGMDAKEALKLLREIAEEKEDNIFDETPVIVVSQLGGPAKVFFAPLQQLLQQELGEQMHSIVVPGDLHFQEEEFLKSLR